MRSLILLPYFGFLSAAHTPSTDPSKEKCFMPIDVVFVQDTTQSFDDDLPNVRRQLPSLIDAILKQNPSSHFGLVDFKDKPLYNFGTRLDYCYKLDHKLTADITSFAAAYSALRAKGGDDLPEAQLHGIISAATSTEVGWRPILRPTPEGSNAVGAKLIILSTDAIAHIKKGSNHKPYKPAYPGRDPNDSPVSACRSFDYPTLDDVKTVLAGENVYLAILTPHSDKISPFWHEINTGLLGQPKEFYQYIRSDSSDFVTGVLKAIEAVSSTACKATQPPPPPSTTTTTVPPSTITTTTTPVPTTTTTPVPTTTTTPVPTTTTTPVLTTTTTPVSTTTTTPVLTTTTTPVLTTTTTPVPATTTTPVPATTTTPAPAVTTAVLITLPVETTLPIETSLPRETTIPKDTTTAEVTRPCGDGTTTPECKPPCEHECHVGCHCKPRPPPCNCKQPCHGEHCPCKAHCDDMRGILLRVGDRPKKLTLTYES